MQDLHSYFDLRGSLVAFLEEDIGSGDITSQSTIPSDLTSKAHIVCKSEDAIVSGLFEAAMIFDICDCTAKNLVDDGRRIRKGAHVMEIRGRAQDILKAERTALNLLMRMSGIATETSRLVKLAGRCQVLATRKTAPGLRYFDKKAVMAGGGGAHRMRLDDMVLIKDNHIAIGGSPKECISKARILAGRVKVECEVKNTKEAIEAILAGADIVMLDNFTPAQAEKTIRILSSRRLRKKCKIEISGGVNQKNIKLFARARPDYISLGHITHSAAAVDFSLEIKGTRK